MELQNNKDGNTNRGKSNGIVKLTIIFIIIFMLVIFLSVFTFDSIGSFVMSLLQISFIEIIAFIFLKILLKWCRYGLKKTEEYDDKIIKKAISDAIPDAQFIRNQCIPPEILREYGILPAYDTYLNEGMIHYRKNGKDYSFSNIHLIREETDQYGNTTDTTCYVGQVYTACYKTEFPGSIRIFSTKMLNPLPKKSRLGYPEKRPEEVKFETENRQFNDNFDVYTTNAQSAFFVLTPLVMEQLLEMKKNYEQLGIYISGNHLVTTLKTNRTLFAVKWYKPDKAADALAVSKKDIQEMLKTFRLLDDSINGSTDSACTNM